MSAQFTEGLHHRGQLHCLFALPLEPFLDSQEKRALLSDLHRHTACHRGYVGEWVIVDGMLFLNCLHTLRDDDLPLEVLFPGARGPVFASWFSGLLRCPKGALLKYVHMDFESVYERELQLVVKNGLVLDERMVVNPPPPPRDPAEALDIPEFLKRRSN